MFYIGFISAAIFLLCLLWSYYRAGFVAALFIGIIFNSSYMTLGYATYIYPNQTEAFFSLLAFILFFSKKASSKKLLLAGLFSAFAAFSKITGIVLPIFLTIFIFKKKKQGELKTYFLGGLLGTILVFGLFILFYDFQSLIVTFKGFFSSYLGRVLSSQLSTNLASFLDILLSALFFPVFIAAFICLSCYRDEEIKITYLIGWAYVLMMYVIYSFTKRGNLPFPNYIYSSYIYFLLGLAFYLSKLFHRDNPPDHPLENRTRSILILGLMAFSFIIIGLIIGILYPPSLKAESFADIFPQADIFKPGYGMIIPFPVRLLYILGPLMVIGLLAFIEYSKSKKGVLLLILSVSFWSSAFDGGIAYRKAYEDRIRADFFYKTAPLLGEVPAERFSVYVTTWNKNKECHRIPWLYGVLFKEKNDHRKMTAEFILENFKQTNENIQYILSPEGLKNVQGDYLLTDDVQTVSKYLLNVDIIKEIRRPEIVLFVLRKGPMDLGRPVYQNDFSDWGQPTKIISSENDNLAPPFSIGVLRGTYRFERLREENQNIIKISLENRHLKERSCVQFGYYEMGIQGLNLRIEPEDTVVFKIRARLSENAEGSADIFIQSQDAEWTISSEKILSSAWKEYIVFQEIMRMPQKINLGIWYRSEQAKEYLEIQSPQIYVLPSRKMNLE
jgi:hypothetical protein